MIARVLLCVIIFLSTSLLSYAEQNLSSSNNSWVIYLALDPYEASEISRTYHVDIDIKQYKYPLYVGYVYSLDSKKVKYKAFTPLVENILKRWSGSFPQNTCVIPHIASYKLGDENFIYGASFELQQYKGFVVIMQGVGVKPDDEWRPVFQQMFTIDDDPAATSKKMNKILKTYWPKNILPGHE
jgi:hypothetical protein